MIKGGISDYIWKLGNLYIYECPPKWISAETDRLIYALLIFHRNNLPPLKGGWSDQPFWFAQAYSIFTEEFSNRPKET